MDVTLEQRIKAIEDTLTEQKGDAVTYFNLGKLCQDAEAVDRAIDYYQKSYQLEPNNIDLLLNLYLATNTEKRFVDSVKYGALFFNYFLALNNADSLVDHKMVLANDYRQATTVLVKSFNLLVNKNILQTVHQDLQMHLIRCLFTNFSVLRCEEFFGVQQGLELLIQQYKDQDTQLELVAKIYDFLRFYYWSTAKSYSDLRSFDVNVVRHYSNYINLYKTKNNLTPRKDFSGAEKPNLVYVVHKLNFELGYAIAPIIYSQLLGHQQLASGQFTIFLYVLNDISDEFKQAIKHFDLTVRDFSEIDNPETLLKTVRDTAQDDNIDIALFDMNLSLHGAMVVTRIAPLQLYWGMGFFNWDLTNLDYFILPKRMTNIPEACQSRPNITHVQPRAKSTLYRELDPVIVEEARAQFPDNKIMIGNYGRLGKVTVDFLNAIKQVLANNDNVICVLAGTQDGSLIKNFINQHQLQQQLFLIDKLVDGQVYSSLFHIYVDTFPIYGGTSCMEAMVRHKPVVHMPIADEGGKDSMGDWRDLELAASDVDDYVKLVNQLLNDNAFYQAAAERAADIIAPMMDVKQSARMMEQNLLQLIPIN